MHCVEKSNPYGTLNLPEITSVPIVNKSSWKVVWACHGFYVNSSWSGTLGGDWWVSRAVFGNSDLSPPPCFFLLVVYFLSSAYVVSPGPTSQKFFFCFSFFHSVSNFLGASLVKALASGSGSGIPHLRTLNPAIQEIGWAMPHWDF